MDFSVYLPDQIGERAKKEELKLSRMLRDAVIKEFERRDATEATLSSAQTYEFEMVTEEGRPYIARLTGARIAGDAGVGAYLTTDKRVFLHDGVVITRIDDDEVADVLRLAFVDEPDEYIAACAALGIKAVIDL